MDHAEYEPEWFYDKNEYSRDTQAHTTVNKQLILVRDMDDSHLYNSAKKLGKDKFFKEMIFRLFEERLKNVNT